MLAYLPHQAYPTVLGELLTARYRQQTVTVANRGEYGEEASGRGEERLARLLVTEPWDVLLLMEGVNDLNQRGVAAIGDVANALRAGVRRAKTAGVQMVFLATLLPQRPGASRAFAPDAIVPMNVVIRSLAGSEGAVLVDLHAAFQGSARQFMWRRWAAPERGWTPPDGRGVPRGDHEAVRGAARSVRRPASLTALALCCRCAEVRAGPAVWRCRRVRQQHHRAAPASATGRPADVDVSGVRDG